MNAHRKAFETRHSDGDAERRSEMTRIDRVIQERFDEVSVSSNNRANL